MNLPRPLAGTSSKNRYLNAIRRELKRAIPSRGRGIRLKQRSNGTIIESRPGRGGSAISGMVFRGDYNNVRLYKRGDVVKIAGGIASGVYVRITDQTDIQEFPWMGGGWVQLSKLLDQWL